MEKFQEQMIAELFSHFENKEFQKLGVAIINDMPDYWFEESASSSKKFHPLYTCGQYGLFYHSYAVATLALNTMNLEQYKNRYTAEQRDAIILASFVHDGQKHGSQKGTVFNHPLLMAEKIQSYKGQFDIDDEIFDFMAHVISTHMGEWNTQKKSTIVLPKPDTEAAELVHLFDYLASRKCIEVHMEDMAPVEKPTIENCEFPFGKHKGETIKVVMEKDPSYIEWAKNNIYTEPIRTLLKRT